MGKMTEIDMLNRIAGGNGSDLILSGVTSFSKPVANLIVLDDDTVIDDVKYVGNDNTLVSINRNYIGETLPAQTLISFKEPIVELNISSGRVMVYFI